MTYSIWVFPKAFSSNDLLVCEVTGSAANQLRLNTSGEAEVSQWGGTVTLTETSKVLTTSTWHMITFTYNGTTNIIYIDGVATTPTSATAHQTATTTQVFIGTYGSGEFLNGELDDARVYNRALSAADVAQLYLYTGRGLFTLIDR